MDYFVFEILGFIFIIPELDYEWLSFITTEYDKTAKLDYI